MATTVTVKGQVTLPKAVRDAVGIKPGDRVEVHATPSGGVLIEKVEALWTPIAAADDWSVFEAKIAEIRSMAEAYGADPTE